MERHKRVHTGEKPFTCPECNQKFTSGSNLKQHQMVHQTENYRKKYQCKFCDKTFFYVSSIKKHAQAAHPDKLTELGTNSAELCRALPQPAAKNPEKEEEKSEHKTHHLHVHVDSCGHVKVWHNGHIDYVHDGELHHVTDQGRISHHTLEISPENPSVCRPVSGEGTLPGKSDGFTGPKNYLDWLNQYFEKIKACSDVPLLQPMIPDISQHAHSETCGHVSIIHGNHVDYLVEGRLHRPHETHCDDHGAIEIVPE